MVLHAIKFKVLLQIGTLVTGLLFAALFLLLTTDTSPILIESMESKTGSGGKVFNRIQFQSTATEDIWLMEQSHAGVDASPLHWDKLSIRMNRGAPTPVAKFYQYENSEQEISIELNPTTYRVSCFFCHSNGPRTIRPNWESVDAPIHLWDRARLFIWNLRIKTYGRVLGEGVDSSAVPFRQPSLEANEELNVKTCNICHKESGLFARGKLYKQNFLALAFMVNHGHMPPMGFSLSSEEQEAIDEFLSGF